MAPVNPMVVVESSNFGELPGLAQVLTKSYGSNNIMTGASQLRGSMGDKSLWPKRMVKNIFATTGESVEGKRDSMLYNAT